ncbi:hypothetical protein AB0C52_24760 [Streptomyces sp. NPDC048717]|uniref:hypothetical protein n=1 Tax=Streptomyces sp. NPDC048717 TaxID=3154928 RepID=UPI00344581CA
MAIRLSVPLAEFSLTWNLFTGTAMDTVRSAFVTAMLGFTWHAGVHVTWESDR